MEMFEGYCSVHSKMLKYYEAVKLEKELTEMYNECHYYIVQHSQREIDERE